MTVVYSQHSYLHGKCSDFVVITLTKLVCGILHQFIVSLPEKRIVILRMSTDIKYHAITEQSVLWQV